MGRTFSKGTPDQFISELRNKIQELEGQSNISESTDITASFSTSDIDRCAKAILDSVGSRAGVMPAYAINLGDGSFGWLYDDDGTGELVLFDLEGNITAQGESEIVSYVSNTWGATVKSAYNTSDCYFYPYDGGSEDEVIWGGKSCPVDSACNTCNIPASPNTSDDVYATEGYAEGDQDEYNSICSELINKFKREGYDTNSIEVKNSIDAAAEYILITRDDGDINYSVDEWWKDTETNYPEYFEGLPVQKAMNTDFSETAINASEELTPEGFYQFFSVSAEPELMDRAAKILYEWYSNEGEEFLPEYVDILDMCDAADDETEKRIVLEAMGEETYDRDDEDVDDDIYSAEDVSTDNDAVIEWFDDASASVMDADWTADGEIIVSLDHNVQDIETTAAELISCIEPNGYHVSDWNVNGHNVFIFEVISNDEYAELAADHSHILEDDDIYSATALYQNPYDEEGGDVECATIADNGEQVFQLMEYNSYPEAGIEGDDFYCYGEFFATDEDDALKQLEEAKSAYPEFANLADQARLFVQPYNEHFSTGGEIYQNVSAIAQHLNQDFHDKEIPFA